MTTATPRAPVGPIVPDADAALWDWSWLRHSEPLDRMRLTAIARNHAWDPNALAALIQIESGGDPQAVNPKSGASGLIQWMRDTAKDYGTTLPKIRRMSAQDQLALAERYWQNVYRGKLADVGDYYMGGFAPAFIGAPEDTVIEVNGKKALKGTSLYDQNAGLDWNADGIISAGDVRSLFRSIYANWLGMHQSGKIGDLDLVSPAVGPPPKSPFRAGPSAKPWAWVAAGTLAAGLVFAVRRLRAA